VRKKGESDRETVNFETRSWRVLFLPDRRVVEKKKCTGKKDQTKATGLLALGAFPVRP